jgi:hypothetical protein
LVWQLFADDEWPRSSASFARSDFKREHSALCRKPQLDKVHEMANEKLVVIYPRPKDVEDFEKVYKDEQVRGGSRNQAARARLSQPIATLAIS